ncbi:Rho1 guanine nucleotide exchange factor 3 [Neolecta irregularis DAH-3]|uniref:Rho1 guanine nucleotide exchange factor 3 n=1 Tax=Neolecta irregularis (strain DAH-3) TaxID=1198029 RepID=A0A1U7LQA1_NEOID|nr:Rho1 guanine nucleotide exchange factor 3 [Neolecta irregularis DAH-3]|eukprot:OLL24809.1 Rho1 guanine nucleotide exchange factor 3 [Neolecta irregularis DAH-3]
MGDHWRIPPPPRQLPPPVPLKRDHRLSNLLQDYRETLGHLQRPDSPSSYQPYEEFEDYAVRSDRPGTVIYPSSSELHPQRKPLPLAPVHRHSSHYSIESAEVSPSDVYEDYLSPVIKQNLYQHSQLRHPLPPVPNNRPPTRSSTSSQYSFHRGQELIPETQVHPNIYEVQSLDIKQPLGPNRPPPPIPYSSSYSRPLPKSTSYDPSIYKHRVNRSQSHIVPSNNLGVVAVGSVVRSQSHNIIAQHRRTPSEPIPPTGLTPLLPSLPPTFNNKLSAKDFERCEEPWALSSLAIWVSELNNPLMGKESIHGLTQLFQHYVPTLSTVIAENLAKHVLSNLMSQGAFEQDGDHVQYTGWPVTGVLPTLSGRGCYSPRCLDGLNGSRCYAPRCSRTLYKITMQPTVANSKDWMSYWSLTDDQLEDLSKEEITRQNVIHEIIFTEDEYVYDLDLLLSLYRESLTQHVIFDRGRLDYFRQMLFGRLEPILKYNHALLNSLRQRQSEQKWLITELGDSFLEWIRRARKNYISYNANFPNADALVREEKAKNPSFRLWLDKCQADVRSRRLEFRSFLQRPTQRLQRYTLLLETVLKKTNLANPDKEILELANEEIKAVCRESDIQVAITEKKLSLRELDDRIVFRSNNETNLELKDPGREILMRGDVQRKSETGLEWLDIHLVLLDNFLLMTKVKKDKDLGGNRYYVSKQPIPLDLLVIAPGSEECVVKSSTTKVLGTLTSTVNTNGSYADLSNTRSQRSHSFGRKTGAIQPGHSLHLGDSSPSPNDKSAIFPFTIKHLGKSGGEWTLFAADRNIRQQWIERILFAKSRRVDQLAQLNVEPFYIRVLSDACFGNVDGSTGVEMNSNGAMEDGFLVPGSPLDSAFRELKEEYPEGGRAPTFARVTCATEFTHDDGSKMILIGTEQGLWVAKVGDIRGWRSILTLHKIQQIEVLEEFGVIVVLADQILTAYTMDILSPGPATKPAHKLSGKADVGFFSVGRQKDRLLVIYKKKQGMNSVFKALEPVVGKTSSKKNKFSLRRSAWSASATTEFFREFDEFFIPTDCYGVHFFKASMCIKCTRGFEVLTLDTKQPETIPNLRESNLNALKSRLDSTRPLGMFRLNENEFLLCYDECGLYVDKHGDVSRQRTLEWYGRPRHVAHYYGYVVGVNSDFVEVHDADNGVLVQIIPGRDIRLLSSSDATGEGVVLAMVHPERSDRQAIVLLSLLSLR